QRLAAALNAVAEHGHGLAAEDLLDFRRRVVGPLGRPLHGVADRDLAHSGSLRSVPDASITLTRAAYTSPTSSSRATAPPSPPTATSTKPWPACSGCTGRSATPWTGPRRCAPRRSRPTAWCTCSAAATRG